MLTLQVFLKVVFLLCVLVAGAMAIVHQVRGYRILVSSAVVALSVGMILDSDFLGLLMFLLAAGVLMPAAIMVLSRAAFWLVWSNVRKQFPDEPKQPPCERLTFAGAYRVLWLA